MSLNIGGAAEFPLLIIPANRYNFEVILTQTGDGSLILRSQFNGPCLFGPLEECQRDFCSPGESCTEGIYAEYSTEGSSSVQRIYAMVSPVAGYLSIITFVSSNCQILTSWEGAYPCGPADVCRPCTSYSCQTGLPICDGSSNVICESNNVPSTPSKAPTHIASLEVSFYNAVVGTYYRVNGLRNGKHMYEANVGQIYWTGSVWILSDEGFLVFTTVQTGLDPPFDESWEVSNLPGSFIEVSMDPNFDHRRSLVIDISKTKTYSRAVNDNPLCESQLKVSVKQRRQCDSQIAAQVKRLQTCVRRVELHSEITCTPIDFRIRKVFLSGGVNPDSLCTSSNSYYFVENGRRRFTCVGYSQDIFSNCRSDRIICSGLGTYGDIESHVGPLRLAISHPHRRHPQCPGFALVQS